MPSHHFHAILSFIVAYQKPNQCKLKALSLLQ